MDSITIYGAAKQCEQTVRTAPHVFSVIMKSIESLHCSTVIVTGQLCSFHHITIVIN